MNRLIQPAYAKINLGLAVLGKRKDGYHELRTVYQTISLRDRLIFEYPMSRFSFRSEGIGVPRGEENLVVRAALAFSKAARKAPRVRITLEKRIPTGAGLGGGSSNAAVTLLALNRIHDAPLGPDALLAIAAELGSDVPFFLRGGTVLGLGRGEILRPLKDFETHGVVLLVPEFGISTAEAFRRVDTSLTPRRGQISIYRFWSQRVRANRASTVPPNDLEHAVEHIHPRLGQLLGRLRSTGAIAAAMTGSGSAVYGLYAGEGQAAKAFKSMTGLPVAHVWLGRTVGAAEYSSQVRF